MCKFSVIVPVYKVEKYLHRCVDSILAQTVTDFEIILIDDGSPDRSGEICDEYAAKDSRIHVIHQENGGVSKARNAGLDIAQGEYIVFVDSDDWVDTDYLEQFLHSFADMIIAGYQIEGNGISSPVRRQYNRQLYSEITHDLIAFHFERGLLNYVWAKAFFAPVIQHNHLCFDESMNLTEDTLFVVQYAFHCTSIQQIEAVGYHYVKYTNNESLTSGPILNVSMIDKLESSNSKIHHAMQRYMGDAACSAVIRRMIPLYRQILFECIHNPDCKWIFVKHLFAQNWFGKVLDYTEILCADEDAKFHALLKTKSPMLFWIYRHFTRVKTKLYRGTQND